MKKTVTLLVAMMSLMTVQACVKKTQVADITAPVAVIVMDTTQALLSGAQVKIGNQTFTTSFDGRIVLKPEQIAGVKALIISCEGYEDLKIQEFKEFKGFKDSTLIVRLTPKPGKASKNDNRYAAGPRRTRDSEVVLCAMDAAPMAKAYAVAEMAEEADVVVGYGGTMAANNNVSAGKLTAGEVNDFTKWYFWPRVIDSTHQRFVKDWRIEPRERYTVQVVNKEGYPVVNYPVNLTDTKGNTIFQAITDNTGKAELWGNLMANGLKANGEWKEGLNTLVVDEPCEAPEGVDVLFVFDATGSMGDELHYMQAEMKDVIARAKAATGGLNIRTGAVVYRDHCDEYLTRISRLTDDIATTQQFIDKQKASGGGDYEEAIPEALMAALNSAGWDSNARARIAFLILDAPCHQDSATLALLHEQILNAAAQGVRIVPVVCSGLGESGEYLLRAMALATNGTSFFLTDDSGIGFTHLKPTTDSLKVEHLNDMLVRTIVEFSAMPKCESFDEADAPELAEQYVPNPFSAQELEKDPSIPHGEGVHYLLDVSGKLLGIHYGEVNTSGLPIGVYFIKTYYDNRWYTEKILIK